MTMKGKYTCIFGGGAVRGFAYIGAIKALLELDINIDTLVGSSVGSLIAAFLAVGYTVDELKELLFQVNFELFKDIHFSINKDFALSKGNLFTEWVREAIEKKFYGDKYKKGSNPPVLFKDLKRKLIVLTTDLNKFCAFEFSNMETPDYEVASAVRISCSMPGLMTPVEMGDYKLVDGDLLKGIPLWKLSKNINIPENRVLEFRLEGDTVDKEGNTFDFLNSIYSCMTCASTDFIMDVFGQNDKYDYVKITTGDIIVIDFNMSDDSKNMLVQMGYNDSIKYLTKDCIEKKLRISEFYNQMLVYLNNMIRALKYNDVVQTKNILKDLFLFMSDAYKFIDSDIFEGVWTLKNDILSDSLKKSWLRGKKFKNKDSYLNNAEILKRVIESKREELLDYIKTIG